MITIELGGQAVTVPNVATSQLHYASHTSAELMALGLRTRDALAKSKGARARAMQVQLYVVERELMRRGVVHAYSDKAQEVANLRAKLVLEANL